MNQEDATHPRACSRYRTFARFTDNRGKAKSPGAQYGQMAIGYTFTTSNTNMLFCAKVKK